MIKLTNDTTLRLARLAAVAVSAVMLAMPAAVAKDSDADDAKGFSGDAGKKPRSAVSVAPSASPEAMAAARSVEGELGGAIKHMLPAYIFIGGGSGVVISPDGYALTNHHVAGTAKIWKVRTATGKVYVADVVGTDPVGDILLVKLRNAENIPCLELGDSDSVRLGQTVVAIGNPFGLGMTDDAPTVTVGVVSALHRYQNTYTDAIQTDVSVNPGNSGGPLITLDGKVVGINGQITARFGSRSNTGIAYAIPANQIKRFMPFLREAKGGRVRHGLIRGLALKPFDPSRGDEDKAVIGSITPGSTAEKAGFKPNDRIVSVSGEKIINHLRYAGVIGTWPAGSEIEVVVRRGEEDKTIPVKLDTQPVREEVDFGWTLEPLVLALRKGAGIGLTNIKEGGAADKAGLKTGDTLVELGGFELKNAEGFLAMAGTGFEGNQPVAGKVRRKVVEGEGEAKLESEKVIDFVITPALVPPAAPVDWGMVAQPSQDGEGGFKVMMVRAGGPAERAGIKVDDLLIEVAGHKVIDAAQLEMFLKSTKPGQTVKGKVRRMVKEGEGAEAKDVAKEIEFALTLVAAQR